MRVVYQKTIKDKICDAKIQAMEDERIIERIVLTKDEARQLCNECSYFCHYKNCPHMVSYNTYLGVFLEVEK